MWSLTTPGLDRAACAGSPVRVARHPTTGVVGDKSKFRDSTAGLYTPCRRFISDLTASGARLGIDADRYSFSVTNFHRLLLPVLWRTHRLDHRRFTNPK